GRGGGGGRPPPRTRRRVPGYGKSWNSCPVSQPTSLGKVDGAVKVRRPGAVEDDLAVQFLGPRVALDAQRHRLSSGTRRIILPHSAALIWPRFAAKGLRSASPKAVRVEAFGAEDTSADALNGRCSCESALRPLSTCACAGT